MLESALLASQRLTRCIILNQNCSTRLFKRNLEAVSVCLSGTVDTPEGTVLERIPAIL